MRFDIIWLNGASSTGHNHGTDRVRAAEIKRNDGRGTHRQQGSRLAAWQRQTLADTSRRKSFGADDAAPGNNRDLPSGNAPKTACSAQGGVLYTQLAKFAALAVQGGA